MAAGVQSVFSFVIVLENLDGQEESHLIVEPPILEAAEIIREIMSYNVANTTFKEATIDNREWVIGRRCIDRATRAA